MDQLLNGSAQLMATTVVVAISHLQSQHLQHNALMRAGPCLALHRGLQVLGFPWAQVADCCFQQLIQNKVCHAGCMISEHSRGHLAQSAQGF